MVNAHKATRLVCISNCDRSPGCDFARLNIPTIFVSGGPMEAGKIDDEQIDLIDAKMIELPMIRFPMSGWQNWATGLPHADPARYVHGELRTA